MDYYNAGAESMDVTYVSYGQVQEPLTQFGASHQTVQYRSAVPYSRSQFKTHTPYEEMEYETTQYSDGGPYISVAYDGKSSYRSGNQYNSRGGSWQQGSLQQSGPPAPPTMGSKGFTTKTFSRGGGTTTGYSENGKDQSVRPKGRGTSTYNGSGYNTRPGKVVYTPPAPQSSSPSLSYGYEDKSFSNKPASIKTVRNKVMATKSEPSKMKHQQPTPVMQPKSILKKPSSNSMLARRVSPIPCSPSPPVMSSGGLKLANNPFGQSPYMGNPSMHYQSTPEPKANGGKKLPPWKVAGPGGIKKRRKGSSTDKNIRLKKYVQPKNAVMCLNELVQGIALKYETESSTDGTSFCVSVEVHGQKYRGFGSSKSIAKQAAAEAALVSFVKPPTSNADGTEEDKTPWTVLACFAMYKLFNEWKEGRIGVCTSPSPSAIGAPLVQDATLSQSLQLLLGKSMHSTADISDKQNTSSVFSAYLEKESAGVVKKEAKPFTPNPAKQLPDKATEMNPIMLLHQMRPKLNFTQSTVTKDGQQIVQLSCNIDNIMFEGEGPSVKKAKFDLSLKANEALFGIKSSYVAPK